MMVWVLVKQPMNGEVLDDEVDEVDEVDQKNNGGEAVSHAADTIDASTGEAESDALPEND